MPTVRIDEAAAFRLVVEQLKTVTSVPVLTAVEAPDADVTLYARLTVFKVERQRRQAAVDNPDWARLTVQVDVEVDAERLAGDGVYAPAQAASLVATALDEVALVALEHTVEFDRPVLDLAGPFSDSSELCSARVTAVGRIIRITGASVLPILTPP